MGIFEGYLLCSDCDGTLTDSKSELSAENVAAIRHFQEEGGLFTLATGRFPKYVMRFSEEFCPNTYLVMGNGSMLCAPALPQGMQGQPSESYDQPLLVSELVFSKAPREELEYITEQLGCRMLFTDKRNESEPWTSDTENPTGEVLWNDIYIRASHDLDAYIRAFEDRYEAYRQNPADELLAQLPHKVNFVFDTPEATSAALEAMRKRFPDQLFVRSWATGMELLSPGAGKGGAVLRLKRQLEKEGCQIRKVVCVGDYGNDASMLEAADIGYAVANASEECLKAADRVTVSCDESAIAAVIDELEKELTLTP
ncbi:MAG: HAD family phosphatase [Firmicutes bacterium]|nr:HAD family phosphatase [Bacillota bacterium]